jgi:hypothetical protein
VTFIVLERGGGSSAGYVSSGFFGGLALGRVLLVWVNRLVGERRVMYIYIIIAIAYVSCHLATVFHFLTDSNHLPGSSSQSGWFLRLWATLLRCLLLGFF